MKKLPQYRLEAALLLVLALMTGALLADPQTRLQRGLRDGLAALCAVLALLLLRTLFRAKWRRRLIAQLQRAAAAAAGLWMRIAGRMGSDRKRATLLGGGTKVIFHPDSRPAQTRRRKNQPRWKQLQTGRQRLRCLYRYMIAERIRRGEPIRPADTPAEIEGSAPNSPAEAAVFDLYQRFRYDERREVDDPTVTSLKSTAFPELK